MSKQLTFPYPMVCTHVYPSGRRERVRYGYFEGIQIIEENGWNVERTKILIVPFYLVEEVIKTDGTKVIFDEPFYCIEQSYFCNSERQAKSK